MRRSHISLLLAALAPIACRASHEPAPHATSAASGPHPETPAEHDARMSWWRDARFGLFVHWGLYALPAGRWGERDDYGEWIRESAHIPVGEYEKLRERWNPTKFDARALVRAAKDAGMRYVVITTKHHDGFCNFDSAATDWDVMSTPFHRDVMREIADACRAEGVVPCWYHSIMDWHHPDYLPRRGWEARDRPADGADFERYQRYLETQVTELLTNYGKIGVMWFDGEWEPTWNHARGKRLDELCRRLQPDVIVNNRVDVGRDGSMAGLTGAGEFCGDFGTPEQEVPASGLPGVDWESCMTMNDHWGYCAADYHWKSTRELVRTLVDVASKGGNFLLNVGPTSTGEIPPESLERLAAIGRWMRVNGEAIHGTRASPLGAVPYGRMTVRSTDGGARIYLHVLDWPANGELVVPSLGNRAIAATLLADPSRHATCERRESDLVVHVAGAAPDPDVSVIALDVAGPLQVYAPPRIEAASDVFVGSTRVSIAPGASGLGARYTLDGSVPTAASPLATQPIEIERTTVVRARSFEGSRPVSAPIERRFERVEPRPAIVGRQIEPGLVRSEWSGEFDVLPDLAKLGAPRVDACSRVELGASAHADGVLQRFEGCVSVPRDGVWDFELESDDGSALWIDGVRVVDDDGAHVATTKRGSIALAAGWHALDVRWFNRTGETKLDVRYGLSGATPVSVPASALGH